MKKVEHNGHTLTFNSDDHTYTMDDSIPMTSVTTLVKQYFNPFDVIAISEKCAGKGKYKGKTPEEVRQMWTDKADLGTLVHDTAERILKGEEKIELTEEVTKYIPPLELFINELLKTYQLVATEMTIFSPEYKVSGTLDLLLKNRETGSYLLADWKTNDQIKISNYFQKGLNGMQHLDDCNFNHYSLQLNIYAHLLESEGYFPWFDYDKQIFHVTPKGVDIYPIDNMDREINIILEEK